MQGHFKMCFSHEHILYTAQHPVYLGGRFHFTRVPTWPREGRNFSEVTQQVCLRAKPVCLQSSRSSPRATFKQHLNDHRAQKQPPWPAPQGPRLPRRHRRVASWPLTPDHWRTLGEGSVLMNPLVPSGRGQETQRRREGRANRTGIYF